MEREKPKRGEWIDKGWKGDWQFETDGRGNCWREYECSECGFHIKGSKSNYCPNCGMKMKGMGKMERDKLTKFVVYRNTLGDTRTAIRIPTIEEFRKANYSHVNDVENICSQFARILMRRGIWHDYTKFDNEDEFYKDFCHCLETGDTNFTEMHWYDEIHIQKERHHLLSNCPDDVNLIDVIEMVVDCVCAGMARSGSVRPSDILQKAVANTTKEIEEAIILEDHHD